ncbi:hypothetical protein [Frankia sp. QA3]|uniref:hypothetical protein n=1 Tax=Frankia sp. QA3 TaxID=710111 RepID=UPI000269B664|nr:hypothetical protein [Frankia sp. QA3]EIV90795.1 hypothetical protein FraQA3DRAFT_0198 [Frankia sp. QA3]
MPIPLAWLVLIGIAGVAAAVLITTWTKVLHWATESFLPWVEEYLPELASATRSAFVAVDKVASPVLAATKKAWWELRQWLLKQVIDIERLSNSTRWVVRITSWVREGLDAFDTEPAIRRVVTEQVISHEDLPQEVREQLLRTGTASHTFDATAVRDSELGLET